MKTVIDHLRRAAMLSGGAAESDGQLLRRFVSGRDEVAFEALVRRHGPMVLGVCRRVLGNVHDADDAFQATFLVLVRKARSVGQPDLLGNWLFGVAYRTCMKVKAMSARRRAKERQAARPVGREEAPEPELLTMLDQELNRLPAKYRAPLVLCELQGLSRKDAARHLGIPEGTLSSRLATGRKTLAKQLSRCGFDLPAGALALALTHGATSACVPPRLLALTVQGAAHMATGKVLAAGVVSAQVMALTQGVLKTMLLSKLKLLGPVVLLLSVSAAVGLSYRTAAAQPGRAGPARPAARVTADDLEELRLEIAALRQGLHATRERVKALEGELVVLRGQTTGGGMSGMASMGMGPPGASGLGMPAMPPAGSGKMPGPPGGGDAKPGLGAGPGTGVGPGPNAAPPRRGLYDPPANDTGQAVPGPNAAPSSQGWSIEQYKLARDPLVEAESALKKLRSNPNDKKAADALELALKRVRERAQGDSGAQPPKGK